MTEFTPWSALAGGVLIGLAVGALWRFNGRLAGISSILGDALMPSLHEARWRWSFLAGLLGGGLALRAADPGAFGGVTAGLGTLALAGVLVGVGTRLGSGCTSGHGVCGLARLSPRSLLAVAVFMAVAGLVVFLTRHVLGGGL
jgi:uncharacterized membrane protein YedE/YeeE